MEKGTANGVPDLRIIEREELIAMEPNLSDEPELPACARAYRDRYNQDHNILEVTAVSAVALDESARSRLQEKLQRVTGKTITLTEKVDPSVLGGLRLDRQSVESRFRKIWMIW